MNVEDRINKLEEFVADILISQANTGRMINELHDTTRLLFNKTLKIDETQNSHSLNLDKQTSILEGHSNEFLEINKKLSSIESEIKLIYNKLDK